MTTPSRTGSRLPPTPGTEPFVYPRQGEITSFLDLQALDSNQAKLREFRRKNLLPFRVFIPPQDLDQILSRAQTTLNLNGPFLSIPVADALNGMMKDLVIHPEYLKMIEYIIYKLEVYLADSPNYSQIVARLNAPTNQENLNPQFEQKVGSLIHDYLVQNNEEGLVTYSNVIDSFVRNPNLPDFYLYLMNI